MTLDRQTPAKMSGKTVGEGKEKVSLPSAGTLFGADAINLRSVDAQVGVESNIRSWYLFSYPRSGISVGDTVTYMYICYNMSLVGEISRPSISKVQQKRESA